MSQCGLPTGLVWLSERKQSPNKLFQGDTMLQHVMQPCGSLMSRYEVFKKTCSLCTLGFHSLQSN